MATEPAAEKESIKKESYVRNPESHAGSQTIF